jgi:phytoene dehydrogenase-like protein
MSKVVIIGSGLGGLSCGVILAKNGYEVTVVEQAAQTGGCLQCFTRHGAKFETGMHFVGSASEGQTLDRLMSYLEVKDDVSLPRGIIPLLIHFGVIFVLVLLEATSAPRSSICSCL